MSSKINSITIVFKNDISEEYCNRLIEAFSLYAGIQSIDRNITDHNLYVAESRVRNELGEKLWEVLYPKLQLK